VRGGAGFHRNEGRNEGSGYGGTPSNPREGAGGGLVGVPFRP